jgi:hypothetical protein
VWKDGRVRREYVGGGGGLGGELGRLVARLDEIERLRKEEEALRLKEEQERLERTTAFLGVLDEAAEVLVRAQLLAAGCHQYRGQWRRRRV